MPDGSHNKNNLKYFLRTKFNIVCLFMCVGRHCEITSNEFSGQVVLNEPRTDNAIVPICVKTS